MAKTRIIAFYLPQYYPTKSNNEWYGNGFTEWTNVCSARPLFIGHKQPHIPADLGFYDLRLNQTRIDQATIAKKYGIEGFCYYYYRFNDKYHELDLPLKLMFESKEPDFPYMLCWANETWKKKMWNKDGSLNKDSKILAEQLYLGKDDYRSFFQEVLPMLKDNRYIQIDGKPAFMIYKPFDFPDTIEFIKLWNELARENGLRGIYFIAQTCDIKKDKEKLFNMGFDSIQINGLREYWKQRNVILKLFSKITRTIFNLPLISSYKKASRYFVFDEESEERIVPTIIPNWDHTPRTGSRGSLLQGSNPDLFEKHLMDVNQLIKDKPEEFRISFLMAWNEWAEGNYIEPDREFGCSYLERLRKVFN
jgi:hypothetical protein